MTLSQITVKEQLMKRVVRSGNGGAVWVPKTWLGQEVIVILPEKPALSMKEEILSLLEPYLENILSISLYGSYARNEATEDSDIDVLVITKDKQFKILTPTGKIEFLVIPVDKLKEAIRKYPALYYQIIQEAKPIINASLLEELKAQPVHKKGFLQYVRETKEHIQSNKELINLDALDSEYLCSYSVLYSLLLRIRTVFIMQCIMMHGSFSNKKFKRWMSEQGLGIKEFELCYSVYRAIRDNKKIPQVKIHIRTAEKIIFILENALKQLEEKL
jgi:predicted nucleotidyltransferase/putative transposon-encoded protein